MHPEVRKRVDEISIAKTASILEALRQMERTAAKLLLVLEGTRFVSLLSIGDIQRAILHQVRLDQPVASVLRAQVRVASKFEPLSEIRRRMLLSRIECMPVVDEAGQLQDAHFWDDVVQDAPVDRRLNTPVVIMAGGMGTRLRPLTNIIPKPLIPIGTKPIIEEITDRFHNFGVEKFCISLNYKAEMVERYFAENVKPYEVHFYREDKPTGTAGSLRSMKDQLDQTFFVSNCDIVVDYDYHEMYRYHVEHKFELTAIAALRVHSVPYGVFECDEAGRLKELREKPNLALLVNAGLYLLEPHLLDEIPADQEFHLTHLLQAVKQRGGNVGIFPIQEGDWIDIGEWKEYFNALGRQPTGRPQLA